jgi:hypothetical protein
LKALQLDTNGHIIVKPVVGWETHTLPSLTSAILVVQYAHNEDQLERGESERIQLVLTRAMCRELSDSLKTAANALEELDLKSLD